MRRENYRHFLLLELRGNAGLELQEGVIRSEKDLCGHYDRHAGSSGAEHQIHKNLNQIRQMMLCSATYDQTVIDFVENIVSNPVTIKLYRRRNTDLFGEIESADF